MRLLLIEDDALLGEGLHEFLAAEGHAVRWCRSLGSFAVSRFVTDLAFSSSVCILGCGLSLNVSVFLLNR